MADKIYNLRDLNRSVPVGWSSDRVREYFVWSKKVTDCMYSIFKTVACAGINKYLENILEELYSKIVN